MPLSCFCLLGLPDRPRPSTAEVKAAWRSAAAVHHPDRGGSAAEFDRLRKAYEEALAEAERPEVCKGCGGEGRILHANGWAGINMLCDRCEGTGVE
jgi:DnaJ-class molecular chaperone